jgi:hypothetical protein
MKAVSSLDSSLPSAVGGVVVIRRVLLQPPMLVGVLVSTLLHAGLFAAAVVVAYGPLRLDTWGLSRTRVIHVTFAAERPQSPAVVAPAQQTAAATAPAPPEERLAAEPVDVTGGMVRRRLDQIVAESQTRTDAENLDRLGQLSKQLSRVSSGSSVEAMAGAMHSMLGTKARHDTPPADASPSAFDFDTAQFREVKRSPLADGRWRYVAVLVDAAGRTQEVELDADTGARTYAVMEQIKANPLLEQVYRQIATPLFDQLLGGLRRTTQAEERKQPPGQ